MHCLGNTAIDSRVHGDAKWPETAWEIVNNLSAPTNVARFDGVRVEPNANSQKAPPHRSGNAVRGKNPKCHKLKRSTSIFAMPS